MGLLMESLMESLTKGYPGFAARLLRSRCTTAALSSRGSILALRLAEGSRGLCMAQPVTVTSRWRSQGAATQNQRDLAVLALYGSRVASPACSALQASATSFVLKSPPRLSALFLSPSLTTARPSFSSIGTAHRCPQYV